MSAPTLVTSRLILRPFKMEDAKEVQRLAGHPLVAATTGAIPHPYLDGMAEDWISKHEEWFNRGTNITFAIAEKDSGRLIGCIDFFEISKISRRAEIGYWIGVDFWNKGYCSEAMKALVDYGFQQMNLNKIVCRHMDMNPASGRVMQKAGLKKEATLRQEMIKNGRVCDLEVYAILRDEYRS